MFVKIKRILLLLISFLLASCSSTGNAKIEGVVDFDPTKSPSDKQFDFDGNYTPPELLIDGVKDDKEWSSVTSKLTFGSTNQATMMVYRGERALFCFFEVVDNDIQTVGFNNGDDVTHGDSVEVYFDFKNDASNKPLTDDIQINIGAHGKTRIFVGANGEWGSWNGLLDYEIKLNGTLNDNTDTDTGYTVELMIPYSQVGIDKNSVFGISVGHVARGKDSTSETLQYTWGGLTYNGSFVDPQVPKGYVVYMGNEFYSRGNLPVGLINLSGIVYDENKKPLSGVKVSIDNNETTTDSSGKYEFNNIDGSSVSAINISKDGYISYTRNVTNADLKVEGKNPSIDLCLISQNSSKKVTISGLVQNPVAGLIKDALVSVKDTTVNSNDSGEFKIECSIDYAIEVAVSKQGYKDSVTTIDVMDLINGTEYNVGTLSVYSPSSSSIFGGARGIPSAEVEIFRGFEGINFVFKTTEKIAGGDHIEVFIDTGSSYSGRDTSDYRIDFNAVGSIAIVNFDNGNNTDVAKSNITNTCYYDGTTYYISTMIPYEFLGVDSSDIIGVSFGMWSERLKDWDGWEFPYEGFNSYVAPEYTDQYCRIGLDNGLYRSLNNTTTVTRISGKVVDSNNNPILNATVNGVAVLSDGSYSLYVSATKDLTVTVSAAGYGTKSIYISSKELEASNVYKDFVLDLSIATISGTCNVEGAKVYLESDPSIFTYVLDGKYELNVPTTTNAFVIFEANGYKNSRVGIGVAALIQSANTNTPIVRNITMSGN